MDEQQKFGQTGIERTISVLEGELEDAINGSKEEQGIARSLAQLYKIEVELAESDLKWEDQLAKRDLEHDKFEHEKEKFEHEKEKFEFEKQKHEYEKAQEAIDKKNRMKIAWIEAGKDGLKLALTLSCYCGLYCMGLKFEETGSFTSRTFQNLLNKLKPTQF